MATASITGVSFTDVTVGSSTRRQVTYTASNTFNVTDTVTVTGIVPSTLNLPSGSNYQIVSVTPTSFTVWTTTSDVSGSYTSGGIATTIAQVEHSMTEDVVDPIGVPASVNVTYDNTTNVYDVAVAGEAFFTASSNKYPYRRQTADYKRDQIDLTQAPGEQTLMGWWLRSQNSFHLGAGIKFLEPLQGADVVYRFKKSVGLDPWTPGQVSLLPDTTKITSTTSATLMVGGVDSSNNNVVIFADGSSLKRCDSSGTVTVISYGGSGTILSLTTDGVNYYAATSTAIYKGTLTGTPTTTAIFTYPATASNVVIGWAKQRLIAAVDNSIYQVVPLVTHNIYAGESKSGTLKVYFTPANQFRPGDPITVNVTTAGKTTIYGSPANWVVETIPSSTSLTYIHANAADDPYSTLSGTLVLTNNNSNPIYVHPSSTWKYTAIVEGPTAIYVSGYSGTTSTILKLTLDNSGTIPSLVSANSAADFPDDEYVTSLGSYLGKFVLIGTNKGIRVGQIDTSAYGQGYIAYGPLTYTKPAGNYISGFAFYDRFAYATVSNDIDGSSGLLRIDLSAALSTGTYAWTYDLNSGVAGNCNAVALLGTTGRMAFLVANQGLYFQHATQKVASGYLDTGAVRYNTLENKHYKRINVRMASPVQGSMSVSTIAKDGSVVSVLNVGSDTIANQDIGLNVVNPTDQLAIRFTFNRSATDSTTGPVLNAYQLKALIATPRQRTLQIPLMNFDFEEDRFNIQTGYEGRAWDRLQQLEQAESTGNTVTIQDFTSGEQVEALIEQVTFERTSPPDKRFKGFGGVIYVQARTV